MSRTESSDNEKVIRDEGDKITYRISLDLISYFIFFIIAMIMVGVLQNNNLDGLIFKDFNCNKVNSYLEFDQCLDTITFNVRKENLKNII